MKPPTPSARSAFQLPALVVITTLLSLPAAARAQNAAEALPGESISLWELLASAGLVLIPLGALSILVIAVVIFNFLWLRPINIAREDFLDEARSLLKARKVESLLTLCDRHTQAVPRVLAGVIAFAKENPQISITSLNELAEVEGGRAAARINRPTTLLLDLGVIAPLVGLLGTVVGILRAFGNIASDATPMRTMLLAGGVSQALVATALGLAIGLTAMLFYAYFRGRVLLILGYFESVLTEMLIKTNDVLSRPKATGQSPANPSSTPESLKS